MRNLLDREITLRKHHAILNHWLKRNGTTPITWKTLLEALRDCAFMQVADDLEVVQV